MFTNYKQGQAKEVFLAARISHKPLLYVEYFPGKTITKTALSRIYKQTEIQKFLNPLKRYITAADGLVNLLTGVSLAETISRFSQNCALALFNDENNQGIVMHMNLGSSAKKLKQSLPKLESLLEQKTGKKTSSRQADNFSVTSISISKQTLSWVLIENNLFVSIGTLKLENFARKPELKTASLAQEHTYQESLRLSKINDGGLLILAYPGALLQTRQQQQTKFLKFANTFFPQAIALTSAPRKNGFVDNIIYWMPEQNKILRKVFAPGNISNKHTSLLPAKTTLYLSLHLQPDIAWQEASNFLTSLPLENPRLKNFLKHSKNKVKKIENYLHFDIVEILAALGPELTLSNSIQGTILIADIKSRPALFAYLEQINSHLGKDAKTTTFGNYKIHYFNSWDSPLPLAPSYTILSEKILLIASAPQQLRSFLFNLDKRQPQTFALNEDFSKSSKELSPGKIAYYSNFRPAFIRTYNIGCNFLQMFGSSPFNPLDPGKLPPAELFAAKLFGLTGTIYLTDTAIVQQSYSPLGFSSHLILLLDLYASLLDGPAEVFAPLFLYCSQSFQNAPDLLNTQIPAPPKTPTPKAGLQLKNRSK